jgi:hypothetical protein
MLGVDGVGDRFPGDPGSKFLCENLGKAGRKKERKKSKKVGRERVSKQPNSTAEIR